MTAHTGPADAHGVKEELRVTRREAAERLVDLAYMLPSGRPLEVRIDGSTVRVAVPDHLVFERESKSEGDCVELDVGLRWSKPPEITQSA